MGQEGVEAGRGGGQLVPSGLEIARKGGPIDTVILRWQASNRCGDRAVRQSRLQRQGGRVPHRLLQVGKQPAVEVLSSPGQPVDAAVVRAEAYEVPVGDPGKSGKHSVE